MKIIAEVAAMFALLARLVNPELAQLQLSNVQEQFHLMLACVLMMLLA